MTAQPLSMLRERVKQWGHALSAGEMVAIARALMMLILDPPTLELARDSIQTVDAAA